MGIADYSTTPGNNSSVGGVDIAENCAPGGVNNAIRQVMADIAAIKDLANLTATAAELNTLDGITATTSELNNASRHRQIAQGSLSGSELIIEVPTDIESVQIDYWRYQPSTAGQNLKMQIGSGTVGSPVWGAVHAENGMALVGTTPTYYNNNVQASLSISGTQTASASSAARVALNGFNSSGAVYGELSGGGLEAGPVRTSFVGTIGEESAVTHTLIRLFVSAGTMAGSYRIYGYAKP